MLRILILAIALLVDPVISTAADMSSCGLLSGLSAARVRWAAVRKDVPNLLKTQITVALTADFFEAVTTRADCTFLQGGALTGNGSSNCSTPRSITSMTSSLRSAADNEPIAAPPNLTSR
jgi:hypothetical protein